MKVNPCDVIILEGILILHDSRVRDLMNMKIFVDTGFFSFFLFLSMDSHPELSILRLQNLSNQVPDLRTN